MVSAPLLYPFFASPSSLLRQLLYVYSTFAPVRVGTGTLTLASGRHTRPMLGELMAADEPSVPQVSFFRNGELWISFIYIYCTTHYSFAVGAPLTGKLTGVRRTTLKPNNQLSTWRRPAAAGKTLLVVGALIGALAVTGSTETASAAALSGPCDRVGHEVDLHTDGNYAGDLDRVWICPAAPYANVPDRQHDRTSSWFAYPRPDSRDVCLIDHVDGREVELDRLHSTPPNGAAHNLSDWANDRADAVKLC